MPASCSRRATFLAVGAVIDAALLSSGSLVLVDSDMRDVKVFDSDGKFLKVLRRSGAGPGEYRFPTSVMRTEGDTILIADYAQGRLIRFGPDLEHHRTTTLPVPGPAGRCARCRTC